MAKSPSNDPNETRTQEFGLSDTGLKFIGGTGGRVNKCKNTSTFFQHLSWYLSILSQYKQVIVIQRQPWPINGGILTSSFIIQLGNFPTVVHKMPSQVSWLSEQKAAAS